MFTPVKNDRYLADDSRIIHTHAHTQTHTERLIVIGSTNISISTRFVLLLRILITLYRLSYIYFL